MTLLERFLTLLAPHECLVCEAEGSIVCRGCFSEVVPVPSRCYRCHKSTHASRTCEACRRVSILHHVWVRSDYAGVAHDLIHALKFARAQAAAEIVAELMDEAIPVLTPETVVTYVPTAPTRVRARGYDQAKLIAGHLAQRRRLQCVSLLARSGNSRQVGANRQQRMKQLRDVYRARASVLIAGATVVLVDDVLTTGASLETAARTLKQAGAKTIHAAVFAQAQ